jgi:hypothetical protein
VQYARPDRPAALVQALQTAWSCGADAALSAHVAQHFLWSIVARETAEVYDALAR